MGDNIDHPPARSGLRRTYAPRAVFRLVRILAPLLAFCWCATAAASPTPPLSHEGRWITDGDGRVVILHGVNMVNKRPPYHPAAVGFDAPDARFLGRHGFNNVRLGSSTPA